MLFDAEQFGLGGAPGSDEEEDFLGLPGLLEPDQVATLLRERQSAQGAGRARKADEQVSAHRALAATRKELNALVSAYARKNGAPHAVVHTDLRRHCGGPALDQATAEQVDRADRDASGAGSSAGAELRAAALGPESRPPVRGRRAAGTSGASTGLRAASPRSPGGTVGA